MDDHKGQEDNPIYRTIPGNAILKHIDLFKNVPYRGRITIEHLDTLNTHTHTHTYTHIHTHSVSLTCIHTASLSHTASRTNTYILAVMTGDRVLPHT